MTEELKIATEELYKTFEKYFFKPTIEGCPCCVSESDKSTLHSKQPAGALFSERAYYFLNFRVQIRWQLVKYYFIPLQILFPKTFF